MKTKYRNILAFLLLLLVIALLCISCTRTVYVPGPTRTEYVTRERVDSLILHDSVYVREVSKGDTVIMEKYVYRDRDRLEVRYDTILYTDTIQVQIPIPEPYPIIEVSHRMTTIQKFFFWAGLLGCLYLTIRLTIQLWPGWPSKLWALIRHVFKL